MVGGLVAVAAILVMGAPAAAHVTVSPGEAPAGGFTVLTFRVPNESDTASTTSVEVNMPTDAVIRSVRYEPVPGWTATVAMRTLDEPIVTGSGEEVTEVVGSITWSGGQIAPGEFQQFDVSVGPLPEDVEQVEFPAIQTYSDGEEVRWIEEPAADGEEPDHPVPVLALVAGAAEADGHGAGTDAQEAATDDADAAATAADADDDSGDGNGLAIVALVVGGVGVLLGGLALIRRRSA
jgi:uncharacterized protein YcnI